MSHRTPPKLFFDRQLLSHAALGVRYERVAASLDGKCSREQWLKCNVTAPPERVVAAVRSAAAEVARGS